MDSSNDKKKGPAGPKDNSETHRADEPSASKDKVATKGPLAAMNGQGPNGPSEIDHNNSVTGPEGLNGQRPDPNVSGGGVLGTEPERIPVPSFFLGLLSFLASRKKRERDEMLQEGEGDKMELKQLTAGQPFNLNVTGTNVTINLGVCHHAEKRQRTEADTGQ